MLTLLQICGSDKIPCEYDRLQPWEFITLRLKHSKDLLEFDSKNPKSQKKHAQTLLLIPHFLSQDDFEFWRKSDKDKYGSKKLMAKLKSMICYIPGKFKYFTVCNIEDNWVWFHSSAISKHSFKEVYERIIKIHAIPVVLWYQTVNQKVLQSDKEVISLLIDYHENTLSKSEKNQKSEGFSREVFHEESKSRENKYEESKEELMYSSEVGNEIRDKGRSDLGDEKGIESNEENAYKLTQTSNKIKKSVKSTDQISIRKSKNKQSIGTNNGCCWCTK